MHDWTIAARFGRRLERQLRPGVTSLFPYPVEDAAAGAEAIWNEHRESTRGRDLDITGMSYALLEQTPLQWPMRAGESAGRARLYTDGVFPTADGRARFAAVSYQPVDEPREARYPFSLTTGRLRDQWHGMSRTGTLGRLFGHVPEPVVELNPRDLARLGMNSGDLAYVTSRRGSIIVPVQASDQVAPNQAFMAMHWGSEYLCGLSSTGEPLAGVNALTTAAFCPTSKQPELKHAAVKVLKAELPWSLLAMAWLPEASALQTRESLKSLLRVFPFAACVPFGHERTGVLLRAAAHDAAPDELLARIEALMGLAGDDVLRYADRKKGQSRAMRLVRIDDDTRLQSFLLAGDVSAQAWIRTLLVDDLPAQACRRQLLVAGAKPPVAIKSRGQQICSCLNVGDAVIRDCLAKCAGAADERLSQLQSALKCGTQCGSCVPELKRLVAAVPPLARAA